MNRILLLVSAALWATCFYFDPQLYYFAFSILTLTVALVAHAWMKET